MALRNIRERLRRWGAVIGEGCRRGPFHNGSVDASAEEGSTTVEYAIGVVAAAAFAGILLAILKSDTVRTLLEGIVRGALST